MAGHARLAVFDLDGTLIDSDAALAAPFVALGVPEERITFGLPLKEACEREGIEVAAYLEAYDDALAQPFPGVNELLDALPRWALCSNKLGAAGRRELAHLGWEPAVALFAEDFGGAKCLDPVLDALDVRAGDVVFVGDSQPDRDCARRAGATFALAGWNSRVTPAEGDVVLDEPADLLDLLGAG